VEPAFILTDHNQTTPAAMRVLIFPSRLACRPKQTGLKACIYLRSVRLLSTCRDETFSVSIGNNGSVSLRYDRPESKNGLEDLNLYFCLGLRDQRRLITMYLPDRR